MLFKAVSTAAAAAAAAATGERCYDGLINN